MSAPETTGKKTAPRPAVKSTIKKLFPLLLLFCLASLAQAQVPAAPTLTLSSHDASTGAVLTWTDVATETSYRVERRLGDSLWTTAGTIGQNVVTYTDNSATATTRNNPLTWRVFAVNGSGDSAASNIVYNTLPPSPLGTYSTSTTDKPPLSSFPRPTRPARGGWVYDPLYGAKIIRVTEESTTNSNGTVYSYWRSFNANNTKVLEFVGGSPGGRIHTFNPNPALGQPYVSGTPLMLPIIPGDGSDGFYGGMSPLWDKENPNVLYGTGVHSIHKYEIGGSWALYCDLDTIIGSGNVLTQWQAEDKAGPRRFAFTKKRISDNVFLSTMTIEKAASGTTATLLYERAEGAVPTDEVSIDKSGRFMILSLDCPSGLESDPNWCTLGVVDLNATPSPTLTIRLKTSYTTRGHYDAHSGYLYGPDDDNAALIKENLSSTATNPGIEQRLFDMSYIPDYGAYHTTARLDDAGYVGLSFHFTANETRAFAGEIILVNTQTGGVLRYAHHFGNPSQPIDGGCAGYYDATRANLSRGREVGRLHFRLGHGAHERADV